MSTLTWLAKSGFRLDSFTVLRQCLILKLKGISECDAKKMFVEVVFEVRSTWTFAKSSVSFQSHEKPSWCCRYLYSTLTMTRPIYIYNMYFKKHVLWMMWWLLPVWDKFQARSQKPTLSLDLTSWDAEDLQVGDLNFWMNLLVTKGYFYIFWNNYSRTIKKSHSEVLNVFLIILE